MGHAMDAFKLLIARNEAEAEGYARHLDDINNERKIMVAQMAKEARKKIKDKFEKEGEKPVIVLGDPDWRPAVLGLVAGNLAEEFGRPVFLWGRENGDFIKGSCRSDGSTDLVAIMEKAKDHFLEFGGHKLSGGFSVMFEKIHTLEDALIAAFAGETKKESEIFTDAELNLKNISDNLVSEILKLSPFGAGNEKPLFIFKDIIPESIGRFGKNKEHLSINFRDGASASRIRAISFFASPDQFGDLLKEGLKTNLVANVEKSFFNGSSEIRLRIVDFF
jgi:single-stranded-DNA-specific exonuclease